MVDRTNQQEGLAAGPEGDAPMSFFEHLAELRKRLIRSAIGVAIGFALCWFFVEQLQVLLLQPLYDAWMRLVAEGLLHGEPWVQSTDPLDGFLTPVRIAVTAALFVAAPVIFYQVWMFVAPGLYSSEKRLVIPFVSTSAVMFALGALFCYETVIPFATEWFLRYPLESTPSGSVRIIPQYKFPDYITYTTKLLIAFGLMFELPLAIFFLAKVGLITHKTLLRYWKISVLVMFLVSAFLTPPDPFTLLFLAVPMVALFFVSVAIAYVVAKPQLEEQARLAAELDLETEDEDGPGASA